MKEIDINKIVEILNGNIENLNITTENLDDNLFDLGMESVVFIQIIVSLEEVFDCEIPDSKLLISEMDSLRKILNVLQSLSDDG